MMGESQIQKILSEQYLRNAKYIAENLYVFKWESDFLVKTRSGYWHEVEIKISLSDFKNDAKNKRGKFEILGKGDKRPNYFSYCVVEDMVDKVLPLIPEYAGLYFINEKEHRLENVKKPRKIHSEKLGDESLNLIDKFYFNYRNWKSKYEDFQKEKNELKATINWLKAEYKAATGYNIDEML